MDGEGDQALLTDLMMLKPNMLVLDYDQKIIGNNRYCCREWRAACTSGTEQLTEHKGR
jgi:hypothetical protein